MRDIRKFTKLANELMLSGDKITLRIILHNGNIVERVISPVTATLKKEHPLYSDVKNVYQCIDKTEAVDLNNLDRSNLRKISTENLQTTSTKNGMMIPLLEVLLIIIQSMY